MKVPVYIHSYEAARARVQVGTQTPIFADLIFEAGEASTVEITIFRDNHTALRDWLIGLIDSIGEAVVTLDSIIEGAKVDAEAADAEPPQ